MLLDPTGEATLVDFGAAASMSAAPPDDDAASGLGFAAVGTWGYVAPEALLGVPLPRAAAAAADMFALGATLYALATGTELLPEPGTGGDAGGGDDAGAGEDELDGGGAGGWETDADVARAMGARFLDWALTPAEAAALGGGGADVAGESLAEHLEGALAEQPPAFRDLVAALLQKDPAARPSARDALRHPGLRF